MTKEPSSLQLSKILSVYSAFDNTLISEIPFDSKNEAVSKLQKTATYKNLDKNFPMHKRIEVLEKLYTLMQLNKERLIQLAISEGGKPLKDTEVEFTRALSGVKLCIQSLYEVSGKEIPMGLSASSANRISFTKHFPIGLVLAISAFNHPLNLIVHQVLPAVAIACPIIIKPSLKTPLSCLALMDLLYEAGYPQEYAQSIICDNEVTAHLAQSAEINFLNFIGAAKVGWELRSKLAPGVRCTLEHGGNAPLILEDCTDLKSVVAFIVKGAFYHAGQVCVSVQRVYVNNNLLSDFIEEILLQTRQQTTGNPFEKNTDVGPLINSEEADRVEQWINLAEKEGAEILLKGNRISESVMEPTILLNPNLDSLVSSEEIFGPVVCIYPYQNFHEAISMANNSKYAFQASVFTQNVKKAMIAYITLEANAVLINEHTAFRVDWMPFGGQKQSGLGVGGILQTIKEYSYEKQFLLKYDV